MRLRIAIAAASLATLAAPGAADAHSLVRPAGALVSYLSEDATSLNNLTVRVTGGQIEFRDPTVDGGMDPGSCDPGDITPDANAWIIQTFCPRGPVKRVRVDLGEREDTANVAPGVPATVLGGPGADRLTTGPAADELSGGEGNDQVAGGDGNDVLSGDLGADRLDGGAGDDRLAARDGLADNVICGPGRDTVDADTFDSVALDCEAVSRTLTAPPSDAGVPEDGRPPRLAVGAPTIQSIARSRQVRVYATSSERGAISASGFLDIAGLALPVRAPRRRVSVGGGGVALTYTLSRSRWRAARRAIARHRKVVVKLGVVATDLAGHSRRRSAPRVRLAAPGVSVKAAGPLARAAHPEPRDVDGDEVRNENDNCPTTKNGQQVNTDRSTEPVPGTLGVDVLGDACDPDDDADGVLDAAPDNCRVVANPGQEDTDGDGYGDACPPTHSDSDGIVDYDDNCDLVPNPDQSDLDGDEKGDVCDRDDDGDKFDDDFDNCPTVYNLHPTDLDGDGLINDQLDRDGDGIGTLCDADEPVVAPPGGAAPASPDRTPPRVSVSVGRRQRLAAVQAGLVVRVTCSEACTATSELVVNRNTARRLGLGRARVLGSHSARLDGRGTTYSFVVLGRRAKRGLTRRGSAQATLIVAAVDRSGNPRRVTRRVDLRR